MSSAPSVSPEVPQPDEEQRLRELGYRPVLARRMGGFGMGAGGPAVMLWGWAGVGLFVLCVGLALAEVTSAYPTSGALYYMADRLRARAWRKTCAPWPCSPPASAR